MAAQALLILGADFSAQRPGLGPFFPLGQVLFLLGRQRIDLDAHGRELQPGDLLVDGFGNGIDLIFQALSRS